MSGRRDPLRRQPSGGPGDEVLRVPDAGIPQYWIVDLDEPTTLTAYVLVDGDYELVAESSGALDLEVAGHPVHLDLAALTRR